MKIQALTYKRVQNLGNYSSETLEATAILDENEDPTQAFIALRQFVHTKLGLHKEEGIEVPTDDGVMIF